MYAVKCLNRQYPHLSNIGDHSCIFKSVWMINEIIFEHLTYPQTIIIIVSQGQLFTYQLESSKFYTYLLKQQRYPRRDVSEILSVLLLALQ